MSHGADAADQLINHGINGTVKVTEAAAKLAALGAKNLAALLIALASDNKKLSGKTSLARILSEGKAPAVLNIKLDDMKRFSGEAKKYGVLFTAIKDKTDTSGFCDVIVKQEDISKINRIFERMGYTTLKEEKSANPKNAQSHSQQEKNSKTQENGSKQVPQDKTKTGEKPSVKTHVQEIKKTNGTANNTQHPKAKAKSKTKAKIK